MQRMLIVSNRLPVTVSKRKGDLSFSPSSGGLVTGLGSFYKSYNSFWLGWPGIITKESEDKKQIKSRLKDENMYPVFLAQSHVEKYYEGFCNKTIWPLFHYFGQYTIYDESLWEAYKRVNKIFCNEVVKYAKPNDIIWVHDYHLMLLPELIREKIPDATIGFFLHIPFPSFEIFRSLPWRMELLNGLLGSDLIGFHTYDYERHFLSSIYHLLGYENDLGQVAVKDRIITVDAFPMGIDYKKFFDANKQKITQKEIRKIQNEVKGKKIILSVDRLDYSKGIPQRLEAFSIFLEKYPEYREKITLIMVAVPSRIKVEYYKILKQWVDELVGRINGKYGGIDWTPILYFYRSLPFSKLSALYNISDVALVTPYRDGMNLIAKEYIASKTDGKGVLILSETAGAARMLGHVLSINPNNPDEIAETLKKALEISDEEQIKNNREMQNQLQQYNIIWWVKNFMDRLNHTKKMQNIMSAKFLNYITKRKLINDYKSGRNRLLFLDYDGTLTPFEGTPEKAKPDDELLKLLNKLGNSKKNEIVIISGRDKNTLQKWFKGLNINLVAEHGAWFYENGSVWETIQPMAQDWKEKIREIMELFVDRTPGSFIEIKDYSLVWHYRNADYQLGNKRAREMAEDLSYFTSNTDLQVLEGNKVIEVKNSIINKGSAALRWILKKDWDFILAIGDDWTDEDTFKALPEEAYSIKIGIGSSTAKFNLNSPSEVRSMLKEFYGGRKL
ncbi:bifunctional alpha,alpha-trehalose-phosphate synthase (UDP-forming)/trehalose-phosphatase [candidate division KSB1 bacterium]